MTVYAVNLADLLTMTSRNGAMHPPLLLIRPVLDKAATVQCEPGRIDSVSVMVQADLSPERWEAIYSLFRDNWKIKRNEFRIYRSETGNGGWRRI